MITCKVVPFAGWKHCVRLETGHLELVASLDVGPRILHLSRPGGPNVFKIFTEAAGVLKGEKWHPFGGHRLWHAPEHPVLTYAMDFEPVEHEWDGKVLRLSPPPEAGTGLRKEILLTPDPDSPQVRVTHRIYNESLWEIELAPWALSVMDASARAILPQEPFVPHPGDPPVPPPQSQLLPARPLVLWKYTDMSDPRWTWGKRYLQLQQRTDLDTPQKVGCFNHQGWAACAVHGQLFVIRTRPEPGAPHPDLGANLEVFTNADILEMETLGPLTRIAPGAYAEHVQQWGLFEQPVGASEAAIDAAVLPRVEQVDAV